MRVSECGDHLVPSLHVRSHHGQLRDQQPQCSSNDQCHHEAGDTSVEDEAFHNIENSAKVIF